MQTAYIRTKVRPVRKLFIIEPNGYEAFIKILKAIQYEVDSIFNLIYVNDCDIWTEPNKEFAKRNDVDIIINFSTLTDDQLSIHFGIKSITPTDEGYKIYYFSTSLMGFTRTSIFFDKDIREHLFAAKKIEYNYTSLAECINFGLVEDSLETIVSGTSFSNTKINYLNNLDSTLHLLFSRRKFYHLTTSVGGYSGPGYGINNFEINYNEETFFEDDKEYIYSYLTKNI